MKKRNSEDVKYKGVLLIIVFLSMLSLYLIYIDVSLQKEVSKLTKDIENLTTTNTNVQKQKLQVLSTTEKSIPIVAVANDGKGVMGNLTVSLIPGSNNVLINTNPFLETD